MCQSTYRLTVVNGCDCCGREAVGVDHEACQCVADRIVDLKRGAQSVDGELVTVHFAWRWTCAAEPCRAIVVGQLHATDHTTCGHRCDVRWNVEGEPMPPSRTCRRIGVVYGDSKALGAFRCTGPFQCRGDIAALATEALEDGIIAKLLALGDVRAG